MSSSSVNANANGSDSGNSLLDDAIVQYMKACEAGNPPNIEEFLEEHAAVANELREFLNHQSQFKRMMNPVRQFAELVTTAPEQFPKDFGEFELIREIGRGGMGVIYEARQKNFKSRHVALKMIRESRFASKDDLTRFQNEAEASALLDHPNIVPIYRVGQVDNCPYFTMKLINGGSVKEALEDGKFSVTEAFKVAISISEAVHFAHQRGILHRDLKPANILLAKSDFESSSESFADTTDAGSNSDNNFSSSTKPNSIKPMVSDFGLAKRIGDEHSLTMTGAMLGTPSYMSPEQATGAKEITIATDVYGLGTVLYNMLTGNPPFVGESPVEIASKVRDRRPDSIRNSAAGIDVDIETICMKCLEKDPTHRYASASELADDMRRYLDGVPIRARRSSSFEQMVKWARRNPALALLTSAIAALVVLGFIGSIIFTLRFNAEFVKRGEALVDLRVQEIETARQRDQAVRSLFDAKFAEVAARRSSGESGQRFKALAAARAAVAQLPLVDATEQELFELRSETVGCLGLADVEEVSSWHAPVQSAMFTFTDDLSLFAHQKKNADPIRVFTTESLRTSGSVESQEPIAEIAANEGNDANLKFSSCGRYLHFISESSPSYTLNVYDLESKKIILRLDATFACDIQSVDDQTRMAVASNGEITIFELPSRKEIASYDDPLAGLTNRVIFSPDGKSLARTGGNGVVLLDSLTGETVWRITGFYCNDLAWHPLESKVAISTKSELQVWKIGSSEPERSFRGHNNHVVQVEYSPDGSVIATTPWDSNSRLWDAASGELIFALAGQFDRFSSDGKRIGFSGAKSGILRFENQRFRKTVSQPDSFHPAARPLDLAIHPNNRWIAMSEAKDVRICDLATGRRLVDLPGGGKIRFHPDGKSLLVSNPAIATWPIKEDIQNDGTIKLTIGPPKRIVYSHNLRPGKPLRFDIDSTGTFLGINYGHAHLLDFDSPDSKPRSISIPPTSHGISVSKNAQLVAVGNHHGHHVLVSDGKTGKAMFQIETPTHARATLSPDGSRLAVSYSDTADLYETGNWEKICSLRDSDFEVAWPTTFSPDSRYLLITLREPRGTLVMDAQTGKKLLRIPGPAGTAPRDAPSQMSSDGQLVMFSRGNGIESWDLIGIRKQLQNLGLDWEQQALPSRTSKQFVSTNADTEPFADDESIAEVSEVEVLWGTSRIAHLKTALIQVHSHGEMGASAVEQSIDDWLSNNPKDPVLWQAKAFHAFRIGNYQSSLDHLSQAIALNRGQLDATIYYDRAQTLRVLNQREQALGDLQRGLKMEQTKNMPTTRSTLRMVWESSLMDFNNGTSAQSDTERNLALAQLSAAKSPSVYATKVVGAALYCDARYSMAIRVLNSIVPPENSDEKRHRQAFGSEFMIAMAYAKLGKFDQANEYFAKGLETFPDYKIARIDDAYDWKLLQNAADRTLHKKTQPIGNQRFNAIDLAGITQSESGWTGINYFEKVERFVDDTQQQTRQSVTGTSLLNWFPKQLDARLLLKFEIAKDGTYDIEIGLAKANNFGQLQFSLNGRTLGKAHDGFHNNRVLGNRLQFTNLELLRGKNELAVKVVGKSKLSKGFLAGIEYIELDPK